MVSQSYVFTSSVQQGLLKFHGPYREVSTDGVGSTPYIQQSAELPYLGINLNIVLVGGIVVGNLPIWVEKVAEEQMEQSIHDDETNKETNP